MTRAGRTPHTSTHGQTAPRIALVGYGSIAEEHALALLKEGASLAAVVGPTHGSARAFAERHGIPAIETDVARVFNRRDIDAVVITSPNPVHAAQAEAALVAGKHVLCEIPLAMSLGAGHRLVDLAQKTGLQLMVAHTQRYWASVVAARERIVADRLTPRHVIATHLMRRRDNVSWTGRPRTWTDSALWHHGCHAVDTSLYLTRAEAVEVTGMAGPPWPMSGAPLDLSLSARLTGDALLSVTVSYNAKPTRVGALASWNDYLVICDEATLWVTRGQLAVDGALIVDEEPETAWKGPLLEQARDFLQAIVTGRTPRVPASSVLPALAVLQRFEDAVLPGTNS